MNLILPRRLRKGREMEGPRKQRGFIINPYVFATGGGASTYATEVLADSPLAYWRLAATSGTTMVNSGSLGAAADGAIGGEFTLGQPSLVGDATDRSVLLSSGATNGRVFMSSPAGLKLASAFTYEAVIIVPATGSYRTIMAYGNGGFCLRLDPSNRLEAVKSNIATRGNTAGAVGTVGNRVIVGATVGAGGVLTFYVNGSSAGAGTTAGDYGSPSGVFNIGVDNPGELPLLSGIDECAIYGTELPGARMAAHFAASGI